LPACFEFTGGRGQFPGGAGRKNAAPEDGRGPGGKTGPHQETFVITVEEDLDCSGLPVSGEVVCNYDEGFLAGIAEAYNQKTFLVREVDCWASGDRVCRFEGKPVK
jgi:predicted hydrocarbon binding protein